MMILLLFLQKQNLGLLRMVLQEHRQEEEQAQLWTLEYDLS